MYLEKKLIFFLILLLSVHSLIAQNINPRESYFRDDDGFFFFIGVDHGTTVHLVWELPENQKISACVLEKSEDGTNYTPLAKVHRNKLPVDIMTVDMKKVSSTWNMYDNILYTTETGGGRFIYNENIPRSVIENGGNWHYRIKFINMDGTERLSVMRSFEYYNNFRRQVDHAPDPEKLHSEKHGQLNFNKPDKNQNALWKNGNPAPPLPLVACPSPTTPPSGACGTGPVTTQYGDCCSWNERNYLLPGSNCMGTCCCNVDCSPSSWDWCCVHTCPQRNACSCVPWNCCTGSTSTIVTSRTNFTPPSLNITKNDESCGGASNGSATANVSGGNNPYNYSWSNGGTMNSIGGLSAGSYCVTVTDASNCIVMGCVTINTQSNLSVSTSSSASDCSPCSGSATASPSNGSSPYNYSWTGGGMTQNITGLCPGSYTVTVTDGAGCTASSTTTVSSVTSPTVSTSSTASSCAACDGTATANPSGGTSPYVYSWSNGGTTQTISGLCAGSYTVTITDGAGCTAVANTTVTVFPTPPNADFSHTSVCFGTATQFTDLSTITTGSITGWSWNFDDASTSTQQSPSHNYAAAGTYNVSLTVTSDIGCSNTVTYAVDVYDMPLANFSFTNVCLNQTTVFVDLSVITIGAIAQWEWAFGDGIGTSTQQYPTYIYSTPGTFTVTLTVTSDNGCESIVGYTVDVYPLPVAGFTTANVCLYDNAVFTDMSTVSSGSVIAWQWDFGDGDTASTQNTTHLYSSDGTYDVTLLVTTDNNCTDTITQTLVIYPVPLADFTTSPVCLYDAAVFTDLSTINSPGSIIAWNWNFGDGTSTLQNPSHNFLTDGIHNVSLLVTSGNNCVDSVVQSLVIYPVPAASFTTGNVCLYDAAMFTDVTTINAPDSVLSWNWNFGDGVGTSTLQNPSYNYLNDGTYNVQLMVSSNNNCIDSASITITIYPLPVMNFIADTLSGCEPLCVKFTDLTTVANGINYWDWDFGDGSTSDEQNPENCYTAIDVNTKRVSTVRLIVRSADGCFDTLTNVNMITTWPNPIAWFIAEPQPTTILAPLIDFTDQSIGDSIYSWGWDFGDGLSAFLQNTNWNMTDGSITHEYADTGTYIVEQIILNQFACTDTFVITVIIEPDYVLHIPNAFTPNKDGFNETFIPKGIGIAENGFEMYIYDRWGDLIYETRDINKPWDGKANNGKNIAQQDVYVWVVYTTDIMNKKHRYIGSVTLIR